jgi:threonyl-tRNA synthetase
MKKQAVHETQKASHSPEAENPRTARSVGTHPAKSASSVRTNIHITFPDGSRKEFPTGVSSYEIAMSISEGLGRQALAANVNDAFIDLYKPLTEDSTVRILTSKDADGLEVLKHSCAHLLAHAVHRLYPEAMPTIGPVIEHGFYYDFANLQISEDDLALIEQEMRRIVKEQLPVERVEYPDKAAAKNAYATNKFKLEMIEEHEGGSSAYRQGDFTDLCRGPHVPSTKSFESSGFKLTKLAGAYWRGDAMREQLTRIYGVCFASKKELDDYVKLLVEAEKRNHRKLGQQLKLFSVHGEASGMPFFHDNGNFIFRRLMEFMVEEMEKLDYQFLRTPLILNKQLWLQSGHWDHYKENMYFSKIDEQEVAVKPMNCPGHLLVYKSEHHSYRELPIKAGEFGIVHRHELSGVLNGLFRVRCFTQDDAHIFCTQAQIKEQVRELIDLVHRIYSQFGFEYTVELSTKPEKAMGDPELWELAERLLAEAMHESGIEFKLNPGDGAFYGPKIDYHVKDAIGRSWQCGTIQLDFSMPEKFDLTYEGSDGQKHRPVMIHRAIYGSLERFIGILIEHFAGRFPLWLSPRQVRVLTIADRHQPYAEDVARELRGAGLRTQVDARTETTNKKIREAQLDQVNYILVVGDTEVAQSTVNVRTRDGVVRGALSCKELIAELATLIRERKLT